MAYYLQRIMLTALVFTVAVSSSLNDCGPIQPVTEPGRFNSFNYLKELCSKINHTKECWHYIESQFNRFNDTQYMLDVAPTVLVLVREKADQIHDLLDKLYDGSKDKNMKSKYRSCSNNYLDAIINLELLKRSFFNHDYDHILAQVDGVGEESRRCLSELNSFDPAHIRNRTKVFGIYVEYLKVATTEWVDVSRVD